MKTRTLKQLLLYNYRYLFAYTIIFGFAVYFLSWRLANVGPGIAQQELITAARHTDIASILSQPFYLLHSFIQWGSMQLFGITSWSIRLPSIIVAGLTAFALYNLLKRWFGKSTALLSTAILISADWFLFVARFGTGAIEFSFWLTLSLLCLTKLLERKTGWLPVFAVSLAGLLFVPLGIYAVITLVASLFGVRVFRERFLEASASMKAISAALFLIPVCLALYLSFNDISVLKNLLGIQALPGVGGYFSNLLSNLSSTVAVFPDSNPAISPTGIFIVRYFEFIFILFGVVMLWKTRVNRLNLVVLILTVVMVLVSGLSSGSRGTGVLIVPAAIYMTAGIRHLTHRWKRTFPKNPYARLVAYAPLALLFALVVTAHYLNYFVVWPSQTDTHLAFSRDFTLAKDELNQEKYQNKSCLVETDNPDMKKLLLASDTTCSVEFSITNPSDDVDTLITRPGSTMSVSLLVPTKALVNESSENNIRWIVISAPKQ